MQEESKEKSKDAPFESLRILSERWKNGTFSEIIDDWKWIFGYSARYKGAIVFYTILGILSTSLGLVGSVAGKYLIDIITGYQIQKLPHRNQKHRHRNQRRQLQEMKPPP